MTVAHLQVCLCMQALYKAACWVKIAFILLLYIFLYNSKREERNLVREFTYVSQVYWIQTIP